jgi:site-specific DNA recombinase
MEESKSSQARIAAIYARVSTDHQRAQGTIDSQVGELRELAVARDLVVGSELVFCDEGVSGATLVRPALERLRDGTAEGSFEVLLCHSPDRLARRYAYQVLLLDEFARAGVEVIFAFEDERAETPEGELLRQMQGMIAEYERAQIAERTRRGRLHRARSGSPAVLGRAPYGYRYVRRSEHADAYFEIDEVKAGVVREVFRRYAREGQKLAAIADWLNDTQTPTTTPGKTWHPSTVRGMLVNPAYRGEAAFGKTRVTGARGKATRRARQRGARQSLAPQRTSAPEDSWTTIAVPAIIDTETFALARSRLEQGVRFAARNARKPSLLRGLLVCRECGYAWHRVEKGKQSKRAFYQCGSRCLRAAERRCNSAPVRAEELDQLVWGEITRLLREPDLVRAEIERRLRSMRETDPAARRGETLAAELTRAERAITRLVDAYQDEQITLDELRARMPELRRREQALRAERDAIEADIEDAANYLKLADTIESFTSRLTHGLDDMGTDDQARVLQLLVRDVLIGGEGETVTVRHSIPLPSGGENPESPLHTVRHGVPSFPAFRRSVFVNREGTPPSSSRASTTSGYSSRVGRGYRYPLRAVGQADTLARWGVRSHGLSMVRFALFIEAASISPEDALVIAADWTREWSARFADARDQAPDADSLRPEVERAARLRARNSVLPRQVRMSAEERVEAVAQLVALMLGTPGAGASPGTAALERSLGLRSGRGGAARAVPTALTPQDLAAGDPDRMRAAVLAASPAQARVARNVVELLCLWFPALIPSLIPTVKATEAPFLSVVHEWAARLTPAAYIATFAGLLARQTQLTEKELAAAESALQPHAAMLEMLATQPSADLPRVLTRLRPLQRLKLEYALNLATSG